MYLGKIVEIGGREALFNRPGHPYTRALIAASLLEENDLEWNGGPRGEPPSPIDVPSGCPYHPRCAVVQTRCSREVPSLLETESGQRAACFYWDQNPISQSPAPTAGNRIGDL
jgi:oligopeptide/dipeptide ABC transporter ATP-binding protein